MVPCAHRAGVSRAAMWPDAAEHADGASQVLHCVVQSPVLLLDDPECTDTHTHTHTQTFTPTWAAPYPPPMHAVTLCAPWPVQ